jgi:hypothetical protein
MVLYLVITDFSFHKIIRIYAVFVGGGCGWFELSVTDGTVIEQTEK